MKILHVNKFFDLQGGAEQYMHRTMEHQRAQGHEVHAFSTTSTKNLPTPDAKFFVERSDLDRREGLIKDAVKASRFVWNTQAKHAMQQAIATYKPDVVHLHNIYHHLSSSILEPIREARIGCVQTLHDYKLICPNYRLYTEGARCQRCKGGNYMEAVKHECLAAGFVPNLLAAFEMGMTKARQSYERTVQTFICPSRFLRDTMVDWGEPPSKLSYIPNPAELSAKPAPRGGGYILYAGRLVEEKGIETLVRASLAVPEVRLLIAGKGPQEALLRSLIAQHDAHHIELLGFVPPAELAELRIRAEALVAPSVWYENAPLSILEAMGAGLPVLASKIGGIPELVEDERTGLLAPPGDVDAWIALLRRFLSVSHDARNAMATRARQCAQKDLSWDAHLHALQTTYQNAINSTRT